MGTISARKRKDDSVAFMARVTEERDILRKVSHGAPLVQALWRRSLSGRIRPSSASRPCGRGLQVYFSGLSAWLKEPLSRRARDDARQTDLIRLAWSDRCMVHGYRKLAEAQAHEQRHAVASWLRNQAAETERGGSLGN